MGFFSGLCSFVGSVASGVGSLVKGAAKVIGSGLGGIVSGVASWVKENIMGIEETPKYNPREATVDETKKINELLDKCIRSYSKEAEEYDELAKGILEEQFKLMENKLLDINKISGKNIIDDYIFQSFRTNLNYIRKDLDKIYSKQIANVFSLNNNKLLNILELPKGDEKKELLRKLAINTITEANDTLVKEISKFIKEQQLFIITKLNDYMENIKNDSIAAKNATEQILKSSEKDREYRLNLEKNYENIIEKFHLLNEILLGERC